MNKLFAGMAVAGCAALVSIVGAGSAEAYPDSNPGGVQVNSSTVSSTQTQTQASSTGGLPSTGGPDALLLAGGGVLLLVGGVSVAAARRRQES